MEEKEKNINYENLKRFKKNVDNIIPKRVTLTQAEYDLLTYEEKHNGTVYFISDGVTDILESDKDYIDSQDEATLNAAKKYTDDTLYDNYQKFPEDGAGSLLTAHTEVQCDQSYDDHIEVYLEGKAVDEEGHAFKPTSSGYDIVGATSEHAGIMTAADKTKLDSIEEEANKYELPVATSDILGGVKTGDNITNTSGTISLTKSNVTAALGFTPPKNGFTKYQSTIAYTTRENKAPIGSCTLSGAGDGFLVVTSEYEQYLYQIVAHASISIYAIRAGSTEIPTAARQGNGTVSISNIPYIGSMTNGTLTVYSWN